MDAGARFTFVGVFILACTPGPIANERIDSAMIDTGSLSDAGDGLPDGPLEDAGADVRPSDTGSDAPDVFDAGGDAGPQDEFDFGLVTWLNPDVSGWPIVGGLDVSIDGQWLVLDYEQRNVWPSVNFGPDRNGVDVIVVGNAWVFAQYEDDQWYGATFEYMRVGQTHKFAAAVDGEHIDRSPFPDDWVPESGEQLYFMVTGLIRNGNSNVMERTTVVPFVWP